MGSSDPAPAAMETESFSYFAFGPFTGRSSDLSVINLVREYLYDFLGDFTTEVLGIANDYVGIRLPKAQKEAAQRQAHEKRDKFVFNGQVLGSQNVNDVDVSMFVLPSPLPRAPAASSPLFSSPHRRLVHKVVEEEKLPSLEKLPEDPGDQAPWVPQLLSSVQQIQQFMTTELVTRRQLERYHAEQTEELQQAIIGCVSRAIEPVNEEIAMLRARVVALENASSQKRSASEQPRASDPAWKQLAITKIPESVGEEKRLQVISEFFETHFKHVRVKDIQNIYTGPFPNGRKMTRTAIVEFSNSDVRRSVLEKIESRKLKLIFGNAGEEVKIKRAITEVARQRNSALRRAEELLKKDARCAGKPVKIVWIGERGVTVDSVYGFEQRKGDVMGDFVGVFKDLTAS